FLVGVVAVQTLPSLPPAILDATLAVSSLALFRYSRLRYIAIAVLGFAWCAWRAHAALDARLPESLEGRDFDLVGTVDDLPIARPDGLRATLRIEHATLDGTDVDLHGNARIAWYAADPDRLQPCERWQLHVRLKRPRGLVNPGAFDSERSALE